MFQHNVLPPFLVEASWNVMSHAQKPDFIFRRNGRGHLNRRERQFSRLLAAQVCASAVVMLDTPCSEVVWRVLATHSIRHFPLHFPSRASTCAISYRLESTKVRFIVCCIVCVRPLMPNIRHAESFPWHAAVTALPGFGFLLPEQLLHIVQNMCIQGVSRL